MAIEIFSKMSDGFPVLLRVTEIHHGYPGTLYTPSEPAYCEFEVLTPRGGALTFKEPSESDMDRFEQELNDHVF